MSLDQVLAVAGLIIAGLGGLTTVYRLLSARIDQVSRDLLEVRNNYVRRDDFLRVIDRFERKLDQLLDKLP